jgi:hypothetical protein
MFLQGKDPKSALHDAARKSAAAIADYNSRLGL